MLLKSIVMVYSATELYQNLLKSIRKYLLQQW